MYMLMQPFIKPGAAVHELLWSQAFLPYLAMMKNPKIRSCEVDLEMLWVCSGCEGTGSCKMSRS